MPVDVEEEKRRAAHRDHCKEEMKWEGIKWGAIAGVGSLTAHVVLQKWSPWWQTQVRTSMKTFFVASVAVVALVSSMERAEITCSRSYEARYQRRRKQRDLEAAAKKEESKH